MRELVRLILLGFIGGAALAARTVRGISLSAAWEIRSYESWQWSGSVDEDE